jgi:hypothetical protein
MPLPQVLAHNALDSVRAADVVELSVRDRDGNMLALEDLMRRLKGSIYDISEALTELHFSHLTSSRFAPSF